ncbi:MAG: hypothetical protein JXR45_12970 [Deltaproteobacteria bacterium]|nr:hypothetical protein [Deltaproteobacteria bacterium]
MRTIRKCSQIIVVTLCLLLLTSCDDDAECSSNNDCAEDEICQNKTCVQRFTNDSETEPSTSTDGDADSDSDSDVDSGTDTDSNVNGVICTSNDQCDDGNPCTSDFCNTSVAPYVCDVSNRTDGTSCDDGDPCTGTNVCENGTCTSPNPPCTESAQTSGCQAYEVSCNPADFPNLCVYETVNVPDGTPCIKGSPCLEGICSAGECVDANNPCINDDNPCTATTCTPLEQQIGEFDCTVNIAPDLNECLVSSQSESCFATSVLDYALGYCFATDDESQCIIGEDRICYDATLPNICTAQVCVPSDGSCEDVPEADVSIHVDCGSTVVLEPADFITRDYYYYAEPCRAIDGRGKELALTINITEPTDVTVELIDNGGKLVSLHHLTDMCDITTCQNNEIGDLSITAMAPTDAIIVESGPGNPPESIELTITCN